MAACLLVGSGMAFDAIACLSHGTSPRGLEADNKARPKFVSLKREICTETESLDREDYDGVFVCRNTLRTKEHRLNLI